MDEDGVNLLEHSIANWDFKEPAMKAPKLLAVPVARDILFSTDGKYVPFDIDHRNIYRHYLRSDLYLIDCPNYGEKPETPNIMLEDLHEAFRYADSAVSWYEQTIEQAAKSTQPGRWKSHMMMGPPPTSNIPNGALPAKFLEYTSQYLLSK